MKRGSLHRSVVWFRSDLRLEDNPALSQASCYSATPDGVIGLYVLSPGEWVRHNLGAVKVDFIRRNLRSLAQRLQSELNVPLHVLTVDRYASIPGAVVDFCREHSASALWFNHEVEWDEQRRDEAVVLALSEAKILTRAFSDQCVLEEGRILSKDSRPYAVFTPFKNAWIKTLEDSPLVLEQSSTRQAECQDEEPIEVLVSRIEASFVALPLQLRNLSEDKRELLEEMWPEGEVEAQKRLEDFIQGGLAEYKVKRDFPHMFNGTSRLSPYLAIGAVSARACVLKAQQANHGRLGTGNEGALCWVNELCWRDFYRHILYHFPRVGCGKAFQAVTDAINWRYPDADPQSAKDFDSWCQGRTGFPIVDAAMRALQATGWMHNRLRMIVAAFLTKDLQFDWRCGEKFFMQSLIDGDFASNNGGWQWSASTGTDAQPYFRVFNPARQSERFDPRGEFIGKWVPELRSLPPEHIHEPSKYLNPSKLEQLGYCLPIVDHAQARVRIIALFKKALGR